MSLLGKVFTLLVLLLSVLFCGIGWMVNSTHVSNKKIADDQKKKIENVNREKELLNQKVEQLRRELAIEQMARRQALASLQGQLSQLNKEFTDKEKELRDLSSAHTAMVALDKTTTENLKSRLAENDLLRQQIVSASDNRNQLLDRLVEVKDLFNRLQGEYDRLSERHLDLNNNHNLAMEKLQSLGIKPDTELGTPPAVNGLVTSVATDGTVELNLGHDDGIHENLMLDVHRNGNYLGKVKVTRVTPNRSIAQVLASYQKGHIQAGDRVDSKLY